MTVKVHAAVSIDGPCRRFADVMQEDGAFEHSGGSGCHKSIRFNFRCWLRRAEFTGQLFQVMIGPEGMVKNIMGVMPVLPAPP